VNNLAQLPETNYILSYSTQISQHTSYNNNIDMIWSPEKSRIAGIARHPATFQVQKICDMTAI